MKNFDLYKELKALGFEETKDQYSRDCLTRKFEKEIEVAWYGKQTSRFQIEACFSGDHNVVTVYYYDGRKSAFKTKTHLNEKRALNAIRETAKNNGFEL